MGPRLAAELVSSESLLAHYNQRYLILEADRSWARVEMGRLVVCQEILIHR
ncbi:MAG: hypothetical protein LBV77_06985 [Candidatus Adiutrix intracellularis]|nr:hypothetical protein [Candidatus Adiutrix intracellularis]